MSILFSILFGMLSVLAFISFLLAFISVIGYIACKRGTHAWGKTHPVRDMGSMIIVASWHKCEFCGKEEFCK